MGADVASIARDTEYWGEGLSIVDNIGDRGESLVGDCSMVDGAIRATATNI